MLDQFRGIAAFWVVLVHFNFSPAFKSGLPWLHRIAQFGYIGVPIFFVISGFCIAAAAEGSLRKPNRLGSFLSRRFFRIFPPFWLSLLVIVSVPWLTSALSSLGSSGEGRLVGHHPSRDLVTWLRTITLTQGFAPGNHFPDKFKDFSLVHWTLGIEVQFYLIMAIGLWLRGRKADAFFAAVTLLSLPFLFWPDQQDRGTFLPYWAQFACGMLVFRAIHRGKLPSIPPPPAWILHSAFCAGTLLVIMSTDLMRDTLLAKTAYSIAFSLYLYACLASSLVRPAEARPPRLALPRILAFLGLISYSLYLIHTALFSLTAMVSRRFFPINSIAHDILSILLVVACSAAFFLACERPFIGKAFPSPFGWLRAVATIPPFAARATPEA